MSMRWHLLDGQGGLPNSASKTTPQPANPRRTPLCHPDHHIKREERRQAVGLIRSPFKRVVVRLGAAYGSCGSVRIAIDIAIFCNAISMRFPGNPCLDMTPLVGMRCYLLDGQGCLADSTSKTYIFSKKQITGGYYV